MYIEQRTINCKERRVINKHKRIRNNNYRLLNEGASTNAKGRTGKNAQYANEIKLMSKSWPEGTN